MIKLRSVSAFFVVGLFALHSLAAAENVSPAQVDQLLPGYFAVQEALADDDLATAQDAAGKLAGSADQGEGVAAIASSARAIAGAGKIEDARNAFQTLSGAMQELVETTGTSGELNVYLAHCPMAFGYTGGDWLQSDEEIANPYFGDEMLRCGVIQKQLAGGENGS